MPLNIHPSWQQELTSEFEQAYFQELMGFVDMEYAENLCFPPKNELFAAFNVCAFDAVKVVIIGQDPYHGVGQANGLCFSVRPGVAHPPSLVNIFKELQTDLGKSIPESGDLSSWASQGVLMLNATLSVRAREAGSHQKHGWERFTDEVIALLSRKRTDIIFLLWGGFAKKKGAKIDKNLHHILTSGHPSPLSANRGFWFGNKHFSKTNTILESLGQKPILW